MNRTSQQQASVMAQGLPLTGARGRKLFLTAAGRSPNLMEMQHLRIPFEVFMIRHLKLSLEHVENDIFRAILVEVDQGARQVFDMLEAPQKDMPEILRQRDAKDGLTWNVEVTAAWTWFGGRASRYDVLTERALAAYKVSHSDDRP